MGGVRAPKWLDRFVPTWLKDRVKRWVPSAPLPSYGHLQDLMRRYRVEHLVDSDRREFRARIESYLQLQDYQMEGYQSADRQRDMSVRFQWGHNHDFGDFSVAGRMGDRHLALLATFIDRLGALPTTLDGKRVLDIGCWTGGTSLLLAAMGADVVAVEEVRKYVEALAFLKSSFGIDHLEPRNLSLYECVGPDFQEKFDFVLFAGVLYHVTDPVLALRITFDALKDGGTCLLETAVSYSKNPVLLYEGPGVVTRGHESSLSRGGWNWYLPSLPAVRQMMMDAGYSTVRVEKGLGGRLFAAGTRSKYVDITRAGLSVRTVK